jgi:hypothetical protein
MIARNDAGQVGVRVPFHHESLDLPSGQRITDEWLEHCGDLVMYGRRRVRLANGAAPIRVIGVVGTT